MNGSTFYISRSYARLPLLLVCMAAVSAWTAPDKMKNDPSALRFIEQAQDRIYDPVEEGMETFSFTRPFTTEVGELGVEHYWFKAPDRFAYDITFNDELPNIAEISASMEMDRTKKDLRAVQTLSMYLGNYMIQYLDQCTVQFVESAKDQVIVRCFSKAGSQLAESIKYRDLIFDRDGLIQRIKQVYHTGNVQTLELSLKALEGSSLYLIDHIETDHQTPEAPIKMKQAFIHEEIDGFHLVVSTQISFAGLEMKIELPSRDIKVNQPIDDAIFKPEATEDKKKTSSARTEPDGSSPNEDGASPDKGGDGP